jgi:hypothetical protein
VPKTIQQNFADWQGYVFGFGYGSGERHTLAAVKMFFATVGEGESSDRQHCYDYQKLEAVLTPTVAWLLINTFCHHTVDVIEYGTSPRYGWLTTEGRALKTFIDLQTLDQLVELCTGQTEEECPCYPNACNCGPTGYEKGRKCSNPFWVSR